MNGAEISIREATTADADQIITLWKEMMDFNAENEPRFRRIAEGHEVFAAHLVEKFLPSDSSCVFVAMYGADVLGYALVHAQERVPIWEGGDRQGFISDVSVTSGSRRQGIGRALVYAAEDWCRQRGLTRIELLTALKNDVSRSFWESRGYLTYVETRVKDL